MVLKYSGPLFSPSFFHATNNTRMKFQITNGACANVSNRIKGGELYFASYPSSINISMVVARPPRRNSLRTSARVYRASTRATGVLKMWQARELDDVRDDVREKKKKNERWFKRKAAKIRNTGPREKRLASAYIIMKRENTRRNATRDATLCARPRGLICNLSL